MERGIEGAVDRGRREEGKKVDGEEERGMEGF